MTYVPPSREVLITGCSSGIGRCVAGGLHARGYRVLATARQPADVSALREAGLEAFQLDVADSGSIARALDSVLERTGGRLYALFNNAGYGQPGAVEDLRREVLREQFETNVFGAHELICRVLPVMRRQGYGRIVQNSSVLGLVALRFRGAYNASKYALEGLSDTLRLELRGTGVHVVLIEPGPIESRFRENAYAAFRGNIRAEASVHRGSYAAMERRLTSQGPVAPFTLPAEAVLNKVVRALESPRPRVRYYVTVPTYLFAILKRLLPHRSMDRVLAGVSRGETR
jgi:NAD(P)-dependent dehydrogenase (short-subunit alcohol dehydrogenase family)